MKKTIHFLLAISLLTSCSKKDNNAPGAKTGGNKITQINETNVNFPPGNTFVHYDAQGRNIAWAYTNLDFTRQDTLGGPGGRILKYQYILGNNGLASQGYTQNSTYNYRRTFVYDGQNRIIKVTIEEQQVNPNNGQATTNYTLDDTYDISWDDQSNVILIKDTYSDTYFTNTNTGGVKYWIYSYSGYSSQYPNTLQLANVGLDFFGPYGYPAYLIDGGGNGGILYGPYFAGKSLPGHITWQGYGVNNNSLGSSKSGGYIYNYTTDSKNRITTFNNSGGPTYRFSYQ